jgi:hypothetical protein
MTVGFQVRFYCHTSTHNRFIHFKTSNPNVLSVAIDSTPWPLNPTDWTTNYTSLPPLLPLKSGTAYLPAQTTTVALGKLPTPTLT